VLRNPAAFRHLDELVFFCGLINDQDRQRLVDALPDVHIVRLDPPESAPPESAPRSFGNKGIDPVADFQRRATDEG
jgi:hypothetical protein